VTSTHSNTELKPYGLLIKPKEGGEASVQDYPAEELKRLVAEHKIVVFRGFQLMPKQDFALFGQDLGEPVQWPFGAINELIVKHDAENYIYTNRDVPMHWDGAFIKKEPHLILFQCLKAPPQQEGGGTTFCNSSLLLQAQDEETRKAWKDIQIRDSTEKLVHYGGEIKRSLVQNHPVLEEPVLRYAEPVDDLNPVEVKVEGMQAEEQETFIQDMQRLLYDPRFLYVHRWEDGDIVLADNQTLLHGREAFTQSNERHIQRVNVLPRPKEFQLSRFIQNSLTIRRKEFFVAELPILLIPVLLSLTTLKDLSLPTFWMGMAAVLLLFNIGDMINCYSDYKLDAIYKSHLSNAVRELGKRNVMIQMVLSGVIAMIITALVAVNTNQLYLIPLTLIGAFIGLQYSLPPLKFKSSGPLQFLCLWGIIFFGPMLYTAIITNGFPGIKHLLLFALYGWHQMAIILLNTAEDYPEDKAMGLNTIVIWMGLHRTMHFAWWSILVSGLGLQLLFLHLFSYAPPAYSFLTGSIAIFTIGWIIILKEFRTILKKIREKDTKEASDILKKNGMKVPRWLKIGAYTSLAVSAALTFIRLLQ